MSMPTTVMPEEQAASMERRAVTPSSAAPYPVLVGTATTGAAARTLAAQVHDHVGVRVQVVVGDPDTIERSAGKMRRVVDQRNR